ncbi:MAG: glycogen/starch/alpha-glucan phosphorylase, partial [Burkholderiaceae bacterium]|nr:glycogen/starch/alpha-glucan phosphorylase [Burkholderiaceae bacterium]
MNQPIPNKHEGYLPNDVDALKRSIINNLRYRSGRSPINANRHDWLLATELSVRNRLVERWMSTAEAFYNQQAKNIYYLSMEFLIGRTFTNALQALDISKEVKEALADLSVDFDEIAGGEPDAALGNGGLGRLAACFLDSMATLQLPSMGYGLRYEYGMFKQQIVDGYQVETPDYWLLTRGNPWEFPRPEVQYQVRFGGRIVKEGERVRWVDTHSVLAMAYDTIIPGYQTEATSTLRLWSAKAAAEMNLSAFNRGEYTGAVEAKTMSENITRVLYPDDSTESGRELRLRQEFFFISASMQDMVRRHLLNHPDFENLAESVSVHLNDTHPVLAIPEMMRVLLDDFGYSWDRAFDVVSRMFSYTNHTVM